MERIGPPLTGDERETLRAYLDYHRATLAWKCEGLADEQLRRASMPPRPGCPCRGWSGTWPRSSGTGSAAS